LTEAARRRAAAQGAETSELIAAKPAELASSASTARAQILASSTLGRLSLAAEAPPPNAARDSRVKEVLSPILTLEPVQSATVVPYRLVLTTPNPLSDSLPPPLTAITAIHAVAVKELSAEQEPESVNSPIFPGFEPLTLLVSLSDQKLDVYRGAGLVASSKVSSGKRGYETKAGVFSILEKRRRHHSNLYSGAPMPWMQRLTWTGTALHAGVVPGYPASHGCIRLPFSFAPRLFQMTTVGANVVVARNRATPRLIEHGNLFNPALRAQVALAAAEQDQMSALLTLKSVESPLQAPSKGVDAPLAGPLRILVTRRTERDQIISTQYLLAELGYLALQNFSGRVGRETMDAIKSFQRNNGLHQNGVFTDDLAKKVREVAGKEDLPNGHLYVRQDFRHVFDIPIAFRDPHQPLGTHLFTMGFARGSARAEWMAISLEGDDPAKVLDRIEIPDAVRRKIAERLTPGSSLIIADTSVDSAILRESDDFLVLTKVEPASAAALPRLGSVKREATKPAKAKRAKVARSVAKRRVQSPPERATRRSFSPDTYGGFRLFRRW
jgi:lipoprotein-anchoring transpeptidase ErfK/SrfK